MAEVSGLSSSELSAKDSAWNAASPVSDSIVYGPTTPWRALGERSVAVSNSAHSCRADADAVSARSAASSHPR